MFPLLIRVLVVCCLAICSDFCDTACSQGFRNSRAADSRPAATSSRSTVRGGVTVDGRAGYGGGRHSGVNVLIPGPVPSARQAGVPTWSRGHYSVPRYDASSHSTVRTYSSRPNGAHYSLRPVDNYGVHHGGGHHASPHHDGSAGGHYSGAYHHPRDEIRVYGSHPNFYAPGYGTGYGGIITPPIVLPYGSSFGMNSPLPGPYDFPSNVPPPVPQSDVPQILKNGTDLSTVVPADEQPLVDEFVVNAAIFQQPDVKIIDHIRSLRQQTAGDMAFRRQDYSSAAEAYRTATQTAPSRRASWIRLAWAQVAQQHFADAAFSLKTALQLKDDATNPWITGSLLYGDAVRTTAALQNQQLWMWLQERPGSTDRMLLTAAFQKMRGYDGIAQELLTIASQNGLPDTLYQAMQNISTDIRRPAGLEAQPAAPEPPVEIDGGPTRQAPEDDSIQIQGHHVGPANPNSLDSSTPGKPEGVDANDSGRSSVPAKPLTVEPIPQPSEAASAAVPDELPLEIPISN